MPSRRTVLKMAAAPLVLGSAPAVRPSGPRVVVVGAGAFGGWTAWWLVQRGARVTVVDAFGPGNMRASSGGETRVIRCSYGDRAIYTRMAARSLTLWRELEERWQRRFYYETGALWMYGENDAFAVTSAEAMRAEGLVAERPTPDEAAKRWPQISLDGIRSLMFEPRAGYLMARQSCGEVLERTRAAGAQYRIAAARPVQPSGPLAALPLVDGGRIEADRFVFACGPWLGTLFPDVIGSRIRSTRQEVFYFGPAPGDSRFDEGALPVWVDYRSKLIYGIPGNAHRGFKLADDTPGPDFDPTTGDRRNSPDQIEAMRSFLRLRFPALADGPYLGGEVCQYESSPDSHFIVDRHPAAPNVWIAGGGSGHGFKMGPALGEMLADLVLTEGTPDPVLRLGRFQKG